MAALDAMFTFLNLKNMSATDEYDDTHSKEGVRVFGRDISSIPCFRSSFLYGIGTGMVAGLSYFMFTSKPRMAAHVAYGSFFCTTIGFWFHCRYQWSKNKFYVGQIQGQLRQPTVYEASTTTK